MSGSGSNPGEPVLRETVVICASRAFRRRLFVATQRTATDAVVTAATAGYHRHGSDSKRRLYGHTIAIRDDDRAERIAADDSQDCDPSVHASSGQWEPPAER